MRNHATAIPRLGVPKYDLMERGLAWGRVCRLCDEFSAGAPPHAAEERMKLRCGCWRDSSASIWAQASRLTSSMTIDPRTRSQRSPRCRRSRLAANHQQENQLEAKYNKDWSLEMYHYSSTSPNGIPKQGFRKNGFAAACWCFHVAFLREPRNEEEGPIAPRLPVAPAARPRVPLDRTTGLINPAD